jgi:hypothetical protein
MSRLTVATRSLLAAAVIATTVLSASCGRETPRPAVAILVGHGNPQTFAHCPAVGLS